MFNEFCKKVGGYGMKNPDRLLEAYKALWNNRSLSHSARPVTERLEEAIRVELKDELTHPRTRKSPWAKYFLAIKRISESPLKETEKLGLIHQFNLVMDQLIVEDKKRG
jgi:hypothetical protein